MTETKNLHLVLIHGWGMNQGIWQPFLKSCEHKWFGKMTFEAIDLPGFGTKHDVELASYDIDSVAELIRPTLRANTILLGWSMGGLVTQRLADTNDANIIAQIHIASSPKFVHTDDWLGIRMEVLDQFHQQLNTDHLQLLKRFLSIQCIGLDRPKEQMKSMLEEICQFPLSSKEALTKSLTLLSDTDLRPSANKVINKALPTLRIFGGLDSLVPKKNIPAIKSLYPNDSVCLISKASHAPFLSHPKPCFEAINTFIKSNFGQSRN